MIDLAPRCLAVGVILALIPPWGAPAVGLSPQVGPEVEELKAEDLIDDRSYELEDLLWQADQLLAAGDTEAAHDLYGKVRDGASALVRDVEDPEWELLQRALTGRARTSLELGDRSAAEEDLARLLTLEPGFRWPAGAQVPRELDRLLDRARAGFVGELALDLEPVDATIWLDGQLVDLADDSLYLPARQHTLRIARPGYTGFEATVEIEAGKKHREKVRLERTSAAIGLAVQPAGAWIEIDGRRIVDGRETASARAVCRRQPSGSGEAMDCLLGGLTPGTHELLVGRAGWRSQGLRWEVDALKDYRSPQVSLERARAELVLTGLPAGARVLIDGEEQTPGPSGHLVLSPGDHRIEVLAGAAGIFRSTATLTDRESFELEILPVPSISLLGVLGPDRVTSTELAVELMEIFDIRPEWAPLDRSESGSRILADAGLDAAGLRRLVADPEAGGIDWRRVQGSLDRAASASVHLVAVLPDEPYASRADLWLLAAAPGPALPAHLSLDLTADYRVGPLARSLSTTLTLTAPWLGADLVDLGDDAGPMAVQVTPGGPAAAAGLRPGDRVRSIGGRSTATKAAVREVLAALPTDSPTELRIVGENVESTSSLTVTAGPAVLSPTAGTLPHPIAWAQLGVLSRQDLSADWVVALNQAALHLRAHSWQDAARILRSIHPPERQGIGPGTVDYWLALALLESPEQAHRVEALDLLQGAAGNAGARLEDDDGPRIAPRAWIRLASTQEVSR